MQERLTVSIERYATFATAEERARLAVVVRHAALVIKDRPWSFARLDATCNAIEGTPRSDADGC